MYLKYFLAWLPIVILGLINATIRQLVYANYVGVLFQGRVACDLLCRHDLP